MNQPGFIGQVQSMRGLAALMVAVGHCLAWLHIYDYGDIANLPLLQLNGLGAITTRVLLILFNGIPAVCMFFVISGFVLGLSLDKQEGPLFKTTILFFLRRFFRIYPAFIVSLLVIIAYLLFFFEHRTYAFVNTIFNRLYVEPLSFKNVVIYNALLIEPFFNPLAWTLRVEMITALVLPLFHVINRRLAGFYTDLTMLSVLMLCAYRFAHTRNDTILFFFIFYLGMMLPRLKGPVVKLQDKQPVVSKAIVLAAIFVFLGAMELTNSLIAQYLLLGPSAALILAMIVYGRCGCLSTLLDLRALRFLGNVSYSFYLYHFIVQYIFYIWLFRTVPSSIILRWPLVLELVVTGFSVAIAIGIAVISYTYVERPFINIGKRLLDSKPAGLSALSHQSGLNEPSEEIRGSLPLTER